MRRFICISLLGFAFSLAALAKDVVFPDDFASGWEPYIGQTVTFNQPLYVCGVGPRTNQLYLAPYRLRLPDDCAADMASDSTEYWHIAQQNVDNLILLTGNFHCQDIRLGAIVRRLNAAVSAVGEIECYTSIAWENNDAPVRPDLGDASLVVCSANVENYFQSWNSNTHGAQTEADFLRQTRKLTDALLHIDADIYALVEVEENATALSYLAEQMNSKSVAGRYAAVDRGITTATSDYQSNGFIYRTDRVRPVGGFSSALTGIYRYKGVFQAFEETTTGERFVLNATHLKAKSAAVPDTETNALRLSHVQTLYSYINIGIANNLWQDNDVLIVGDFNCYTMEEPMRRLRDLGMTDLLQTYAPDDYTYVYRCQTGSIDHAFATPSLAAQITGAAPFHLNADVYAGLGYESGNEDIYRYSDHDPVLIGLRLYTEPVEEKCEEVSFSETFYSNLGAFLSVNVSGTNDWYADAANHYARMNGTASDNNEDWLISPAFDLSQHSAATLSFDHTANKGTAANKKQMQTLWMSNDYLSGNPATATWTQVEIPVYPSGTNWTFVGSGKITVPQEFLTGNMRFAFKYKAGNRSTASCWEIKNVVLTASCDDLSAIVLPDTDDCTFSVTAGTVSSDCPFRIFSLQGTDMTPLNGHLPQGVYIIWSDAAVRKVAVP